MTTYGDGDVWPLRCFSRSINELSVASLSRWASLLGGACWPEVATKADLGFGSVTGGIVVWAVVGAICQQHKEEGVDLEMAGDRTAD